MMDFLALLSLLLCMVFFIVKSKASIGFITLPFLVGLSIFAIVPEWLSFSGFSIQKIGFLIIIPILFLHFVNNSINNSNYIVFKKQYSLLISIAYFFFFIIFETIANIYDGTGNSNLIGLALNFLLYLVVYVVHFKDRNSVLHSYTRYLPLALLLIVPFLIFEHISTLKLISFESGNRISNGMRLGASTDGGLVNVWANSLVLISCLIFYCFDIKNSQLNNKTERFWDKTILILITLLILALILLSLSRGALIFYFLSLLLIFPIRFKSKVLIVFSLCVLFFIIYELLSSNTLFYVLKDRVYSIFDPNDSSIAGRLQRYSDIIFYLERNPLTGIGSSFPSQFDWVTENTILFVLLKYGMIGLAVFILFIISLLVMSFKTTQENNLLILLTLCCFLFFLDDVLYLSTLSVFLGFISAEIDFKKCILTNI